MIGNEIITALPALLKGALLTIELTLISIVIGLVIGLGLAMCRLSKNKILQGCSFFYVWFFRGTPLMMQIFFIYYALPLISDIEIAQKPAAIIALSLNCAAYLSEIIRAAIQSIDKGQMEAAKALGMNYKQAMRRIIIPQSYKRLIPPIGNELIALLKDTSMVSVIAMTELLRVTSQISNKTGRALIYIPAAILYLIITSVFTIIFSKLEKKYSACE